jgi:chromosome segregation protein
VASVLTVQAGYEQAIAAALGAAADAVAVDSVDSALQALHLLKSDDAGRAGVVVGGSTFGSDDGAWPELPAGARYAVDLVSGPDTLTPTWQRLLHKVAVVDDLDAAGAIARDLPGVSAVTREGDLIGRHWAHGGSASAPSLIEVQAAVADASERLAAASHRCERARFAITQATADVEAATARVEASLARLHESDAAMAAVAEQLGTLGSAARAAAAEADRLAGAITEAEKARDRDLEGLAALEERLSAAQAAPDEGEPSAEARDALAAACTAARTAETEARLAVRTAEERGRALAGRADSLQAAAAAERTARSRAVARRAQREREAVVAGAVGAAVTAVLARMELSLAAAAEERSATEQARTLREGELLAVRAKAREFASEIEALTDAVHRDEVARTEQRLRIEQLHGRAMEEHGVEPEALIAEYGPDQPVPVLPDVDADPDAPAPEPIPYVRAEQEKRAKAAERALALLGRVNPLALEEFAALEERHKFLAEQLEDIKKTRRDLLDIVREVDERVEQVFTAAYHDTAAQFEQVFARLFPGGEGRLILTDPSDMLTTGIEVEARPPGKKVKRLSLLSGGERSLTAVALLVAIFKARPSPFYVMDEVEAALDDTNLGRLLTIFEELRESSQLIVITHQKRTMEVADALYGVSMRGDGVTTVISQRLREPEPA